LLTAKAEIEKKNIKNFSTFQNAEAGFYWTP